MLKEILKQEKNLCWYPSSGDDFEVTKLWRESHGNRFVPNLFILTDNNLKFHYNANNTKERLKNNGFEFVDEIVDDYLLVTSGSENWDYSKIDWGNVSVQKIKEILDSNIWESFMQADIPKEDLIELIELGLTSMAQHLPAVDEMPIELKLQLMKIINSDQDNVFASLYKNSDIKILFIECDNMKFYKYCIENEINIQSAILIRNQDEQLTTKFSEVFNNLGVKNALLYKPRHSDFLENKIGQIIDYLSCVSEINNQRKDELFFAEW